MLSWVSKVLKQAKGDVSAAAHHLIYTLLHGVTGILHALFGNVEKEWKRLWSIALSFDHGLWYFVRAVGHGLHHILCVMIPHLATWIWGVIVGLAKEVEKFVKWMLSKVDYILKLIDHEIDALRDWVLQHIWDPLFGYIKDLYDKLTKWAYTAWYYITHPQKLADLLFWYLWNTFTRQIDSALLRMGDWLTRWFLANVIKAAAIVETIIANII